MPWSRGRMRWRRVSKAMCRLPLDAQVLVIDLPIVNGGEVERLYRVGTVNFSALLHYNRSYFYASAVVDLSRAIAQTLAR